jgi:transcriptional regulator with XRE-family HTH domain
MPLEKALQSIPQDADGARKQAMDPLPVLDMHDFSVRLRRIRRMRGLTQEALAGRLAVGQGWISRLESGTMHHVQAASLHRLCLALGVSADYLLGLDSVAPAPPHD